MASPKLRFKEFDEDWKEVILKNCITSIDSGWSPQCESYPANSSEWGVLKTTSVDWSGFNSSFNKKLPLELTPRKEIEVKPLDILVTRAGPTERVGVVSVVPHSVRSKLMISDKLIRLKSNEENNPLFLGISLSSVKCQNQLQSKTSGLAKSQTNISQKILGEVLLKLPSKEEQTKIATFLSAVDEKIAQLSQKLHLLEQYKQGMMQKIFSQQIRFKAGDGSQFGAWESKKLNEIGQSFNGLVGKSKEDFGEGEAYITYKQIFDHRKINLNNINFVNISPNDTQNMVKKGDIFFTTSSETANEVAYCSVILDDFEFPLYLNSFCFGYRPNSAKIFNSAYASFYFRSNIFRNKIKHLAQGSTRFNISKIAFMNVLIHLPMLEEQTKIANFLSTIDQKIDVVSEQLKQAKIWKKGLLQQMFV